MQVQKHPHGRGEDRMRNPNILNMLETPPRAWGRLPLAKQARALLGNTPTGVGKTHPCTDQKMQMWKHPHGRGEDLFKRFPNDQAKETPPRAWGRHPAMNRVFTYHRNTPTGVGKTLKSDHCRGGGGKHPHGRGEDSSRQAMVGVFEETPPRAWGRL